MYKTLSHKDSPNVWKSFLLWRPLIRAKSLDRKEEMMDHMQKRFEVGDYLCCGTKGICCVTEIGPIDFGKKNTEYYFLKKVGDKGGTIYVEVESDKIPLRPIIPATEARHIIEHIETIDSIPIDEKQNREELFKELLRTGDCVQLVGFIKGLCERKRSRNQAGKKMTAVDERSLAQARGMLEDELAVALSLPVEQVAEVISRALYTS